jgi:HSP20 family protein
MAQNGQNIKVEHKTQTNGNDGRVARARVSPAVDVYETGDSVVLLADLPGVTSDGLSVEVEDDTLTIEGASQIPTPAGFEERAGELEPVIYVRSFRIGPEVAREKISASLREGVLTLDLPKQQEAKARKIDVKIG